MTRLGERPDLAEQAPEPLQELLVAQTRAAGGDDGEGPDLCLRLNDGGEDARCAHPSFAGVRDPRCLSLKETRLKTLSPTYLGWSASRAPCRVSRAAEVGRDALPVEDGGDGAFGKAVLHEQPVDAPDRLDLLGRPWMRITRSVCRLLRWPWPSSACAPRARR